MHNNQIRGTLTLPLYYIAPAHPLVGRFSPAGIPKKVHAERTNRIPKTAHAARTGAT